MPECSEYLIVKFDPQGNLVDQQGNIVKPAPCMRIVVHYAFPSTNVTLKQTSKSAPTPTTSTSETTMDTQAVAQTVQEAPISAEEVNTLLSLAKDNTWAAVAVLAIILIYKVVSQKTKSSQDQDGTCKARCEELKRDLEAKLAPVEKKIDMLDLKFNLVYKEDMPRRSKDSDA